MAVLFPAASPSGFPSMRHYLALIPLLFTTSVLIASPALAAEEAEEKPEKRIICNERGEFKSYLAAESREGWVDLRFTMKPDGSFTDVEVVNVFGEPYFAENAKEVWASCRYERPELVSPTGGEVRNLRSRYYFQIEPPSKASTPKVYMKLIEVQRLLKEGQTDAGEALLNEAEKDCRNLYEFSHMLILRGAVAAARGDNGKALLYLHVISGNRSFIADKEFAQLLRMRLSLEIDEGQYVLAEKTAAEMAKKKPREGDDKLLAKLAALKALVATGSPLSVSGQLPVNCHPAFCEPDEPEWFYSPYNRTVSLADIKGQLNKVMFRCDKKTMTFPADAGVTWTIPKSWGQCTVQVIGKPGASFKLIDETLPG